MKQYDKIITLYLQSVNLFNDIEKIPRTYGTDHLLFNSEIDTLMIIGNYESNRGINLTQLAQRLGISKSGTSRFIKKLLEKELIYKQRRDGNEKEVYFTLSDMGAVAFKEKAKLNKETYGAMYKNVSCYVEDDLNRIEEFLKDMNDAMKKLGQ